MSNIYRLQTALSFALTLFCLFATQAQIYVVNGDASSLGNDCFQITPAINNHAGSVWSQNKVSLANDFEVRADLYFGTKDIDGADGIAFVFQPLCTGVGGVGGGIGYEGITPSLAVEYDTYQNAADNNDPFQDHIALQRNGILVHAAPNMLAGVSLLPNIENGANHSTVITWDAGAQTLTVFFDGVLQFSYNGDIVANIFGGNPEVFWGFTAATGGLNNDQRVCITDVESTELTQYVVTDASCAENADGAIDFTASPGVTYAWSNGAMTEDISNLAPGIYTLSVTETNGCASTYMIEVAVVDLIQPTIVCPDAASVSCGGDFSPASLGMATGTDNCLGMLVTFSDNETPATCDDGAIVRTWTATDLAGNTATCVQTITITGDDVAPVCLNCPGDVTITCEDDLPELPTLEVSDNCDPAPVISLISTSSQTGDGSCTDYSYTISRVVTVTDACGNAQSYPQTITVKDDVAPVCLNCPGDVTISCNMPVPELPAIEVSDNCDPAPLITAISTISPAEGACGAYSYIISRVVTVTDACGNAQSYPQTITVKDDVAPVCLNCPADITVSCGEVPELPVIEASDNCDPAPLITVISTILPNGTGACGEYSYTISRVVTVTDACGNAQSYPQTITVKDDVAPICLNCPGDVTISCEDDLPELSTLEVSDNCDPAPLISLISTTSQTGDGSCTDYSYTISRVITVTDACGNTQSYPQTITVKDDVAPVLDCPENATVSCGDLNTNTASAVDNCDPAPVLTWSDEALSGNCDWACTLERTWTAVDACGNTGTCVQTITISSLDIIEEALNVDTDGDGLPNPLVLGVSRNKLTLKPGAGACILEWMPSVSDSATSLRTAQIVIDGSDCSIAPNLINAEGKSRNPLLEATLKLSIKVRLEPAYGNRLLSELEDCIFHPIVYQFMPPNPDVNDLLRLANLGLGNIIGPPHLNHLLNALRCINDTYEICAPAEPDMTFAAPGNQLPATQPSAHKPAWNVFPNPAQGSVFADLSQWADQSVELELVNASGQVMQVQRMVAPDAPLRLDVAGYPTGLYFLRVKTGSGVGETVRFVIENR